MAVAAAKMFAVRKDIFTLEIIGIVLSVNSDLKFQ